ncbi:ABC transporter family substrate-binding protein [Spelaeicoccus albus]|uniref:Peptide/nickel transport system substrate-binding protein n=1 Tax=Spelaeicoccus albus TaxID=1280376 RepID=A0A7Z0II47_9MICO|nr:ABC transporter family substrate-binding protein [Spelaeicoccus albus]NYI68062.1 peptide/nickel transport system substrate-binding protein [Spelaeicoccus albus]
MKKKRLLALGAAFVAGAVALSGCSSPKSNDNGGIKNTKTVNVMWNQAFYSANQNTGNGNAVANMIILYMMNDQSYYYNKDLKLQPNTSFGSMKKVSDKPLKVKYTIADTAKWSDGTPVTAADYVLTWAALGGKYNTVSADKGVNKDGSAKKQAGSNVFFNSSDPGMALVKDMPKVSSDKKSFTITYDKPFVDWKTELLSPAVPAHVVAEHALGVKDATKADDAMMKAFKSDDKAKLAKVANFYNTGFDFKSMPKDKSLLVGSGPFKISAFKANQYITLKKNKNYEGSHKPKVDKITVRYSGDPMSNVQALQNGEVDMIQPQSTPDVVKALKKLNNVNMATGDDSTYEHVDMAQNNGGPFDPKSYGGDKDKARMVRQAFMDTIPRQQIVDKLIKPLVPDAKVRNSFMVTPGAPGYDEVVKMNGMAKADKVDIAAAKKLLKQAGNAHPKVRMMFDKTNPRRQSEYELIAQSAKKAGFKMVNASDPDWGNLLQQTSKYDAALFGWQATSTAVSGNVAAYKTNGQNNFYGYSNKKVDNLFSKLLVNTDQAKTPKILGQVEKQLVDDAFGDVIFQFPQVTAWNKKLQNVSSISLAPTMFWNFWKWDVK